ncbi:hypothetical protein CLERM_545 [Coxiella-like endosymbiont]|nr:hypothetical protein CLERM_545 [Coxiella-like endosymbiont]
MSILLTLLLIEEARNLSSAINGVTMIFCNKKSLGWLVWGID